MNENTFDGSNPILVTANTINNIESRLNIPFETDENKVLHGLGNFYTEYVQPNMFPIIIIAILCLYLFIKYILKQDREDKEIKDRKIIAKEKAKKRKAKQIYRSLTGKEIVDDEDIYNDANKDTRAVNAVGGPNIPKHAKDVLNDDIANYISDDYLLTDTDTNSNSNKNNKNDNNNNTDDNNNNNTDDDHDNNDNNIRFNMISSNPMMNDMIALQQGGNIVMPGEDNKDIDIGSKLVFGK